MTSKQQKPLHEQGLVVVLSGFSGAGKGTIMKHLLATYPDYYTLSVSATTRPQRPGEEEGREYFFKTRQEFETMIEEDAFLEHAEFNGNYYGTPRAPVMERIAAGVDVILEIEVQGALQVRRAFPEALLLFVTPPSAAALQERLVGRGTETPEVVRQRLSISARECLDMEQYDYLVVNDRLEESVALVHRIIQGEHQRVWRNTGTVQRMQRELQIFAKERQEV